MSNSYIGSDFDDFLAQEGILDEVEALLEPEVREKQRDERINIRERHRDGGLGAGLGPGPRAGHLAATRSTIPVRGGSIARISVDSKST